MSSLFYVRTAYSLIKVPVPQCFKDLDTYFETRLAHLVTEKTTALLSHRSVILAENLCRRMADTDFYAQAIVDAQKGLAPWNASIAIQSLLVGYFNACKSLLDAGAITLTHLFGLPLSKKEMDFSKAKFWKILGDADITVHDRYTPFKALFQEIIKWRDSANHRTAPLVIVVDNTPGEPSLTLSSNSSVRLVDSPDTNIRDVLQQVSKGITMVDPMHYHGKWNVQLVTFCTEVCSDIRAKT